MSHPSSRSVTEKNYQETNRKQLSQIVTHHQEEKKHTEAILCKYSIITYSLELLGCNSHAETNYL